MEPYHTHTDPKIGQDTLHHSYPLQLVLPVME
jgi:hypothetical protein